MELWYKLILFLKKVTWIWTLALPDKEKTEKKHLASLGFEPWAFRFESQNTNHWAMKTQTKNVLISIELMNQLKMKVEIWIEF